MNPVVGLLVEKAKRSLKSPKDAFEDENLEVVVSRAYYTMFYLAQALLLTKGLSFSKHSAVISAFAVHFTKLGLIPQEFHRYLHQAQKERHIADYDVQFNFTADEAQLQLDQAEAFLKMKVGFLALE